MFKKALVVLMAASALSFALTGCDKTETKTENAGTEAKSEEAKSGEAKSEEAKDGKTEEKAEAKEQRLLRRITQPLRLRLRVQAPRLLMTSSRT